MALVLADRVRDTTTTTGTGTVTLSGTAPTGYQSFAAVGNANTTYYTIALGSEWEVGIGTYTSSGTTLSRDTVLESSNAGALVSFSAGTKDVFVTYPADKAVNYDASGNVGIGTTAPSSALEVARGAGVAAQISLRGNNNAVAAETVLGQSTAGGSYLIVRGNTELAIATNNTERMRITAGGFVGIGTSAPSARLNVIGHNEFSLGLTAQISSTQTAIINHPVAVLGNTSSAAGNGLNLRYQIADTGGTARTAGGVGVIATAKDASSVTAAMYFYTGSTEKMRIDAIGNVGIGITSPTAKLNIVDNSANDAVRITQTGSGNALVVEDSTSPDATPFIVTAVGDVGIGAVPSGSKLDVSGMVRSRTGAATIDFNHDGTNGSIVSASSFLIYANGANPMIFHTDSAEVMRINAVGDIGIGTATPGQKLSVVGTVESTTGGFKFPDGTTQTTAVTAPSGAIVGTTDTQTLSGKTLTDPAIIGAITEDIYTIVDAAGVAIDPGNGTIQLWTLGASRTPVATNFAAGESVTLMINDGTAYTVTWTTIGVVWVGGSAPTLPTTGFGVIELWKVSTTVYGAYVGAVA